jgi:hypothetical protein
LDFLRGYFFATLYIFTKTHFLYFMRKLFSFCAKSNTKGEARLRRAQHEEKILEHQVKQLTRKERTHRLCTRGAMLESFLLRPEVLTDEDVMDILKQAFSQSGMKEIVAESVKGRVAGESLTE